MENQFSIVEKKERKKTTKFSKMKQEGNSFVYDVFSYSDK